MEVLNEFLKPQKYVIYCIKGLDLLKIWSKVNFVHEKLTK
jgi:hypothetical protein